jgi:choline kinase
MYSLWLGRETAQNGLLILNGDVLFHVDILKSVLECPQPDALAVDFEAALAEEEMKVVVQDGRVSDLGKDLLEADGENVGMIKMGVDCSKTVFSKIEEFLSQGLRTLMVPSAVSAVAATHHFAAVPVNGRPWIEIDFPEDYLEAKRRVYPAILDDLKWPVYSSSMASSSGS